MPHHASVRLVDVGEVSRPGEATVSIQVSTSGREILVRVENRGGARAGAYLSPDEVRDLSKLLDRAVYRADAAARGVAIDIIYPPR
jgi:hypothetical protein